MVFSRTTSSNFKEINLLVIKEVFSYPTQSIPTLMALAVMEQPKILKLLKKISEIDPSVIQQKVSQFLNNDPMFDDSYSAGLIVYGCILMYENDVIPLFVHEVLKEMGIKNVSIADLKLNAKNLIKLLTSTRQTGGAISSNIKLIFKHVIGISLLLVIWGAAGFAVFRFRDATIAIAEGNMEIVDHYTTILGELVSEETCKETTIPLMTEIGLFVQELLPDGYSREEFKKMYNMANCISSNILGNPKLDRNMRNLLADKTKQAFILHEVEEDDFDVHYNHDAVEYDQPLLLKSRTEITPRRQIQSGEDRALVVRPSNQLIPRETLEGDKQLINAAEQFVLNLFDPDTTTGNVDYEIFMTQLDRLYSMPEEFLILSIFGEYAKLLIEESKKTSMFDAFSNAATALFNSSGKQQKQDPRIRSYSMLTTFVRAFKIKLVNLKKDAREVINKSGDLIWELNTHVKEKFLKDMKDFWSELAWLWWISGILVTYTTIYHRHATRDYRAYRNRNVLVNYEENPSEERSPRSRSRSRRDADILRSHMSEMDAVRSLLELERTNLLTNEGGSRSRSRSRSKKRTEKRTGKRRKVKRTNKKTKKSQKKSQKKKHKK